MYPQSGTAGGGGGAAAKQPSIGGIKPSTRPAMRSGSSGSTNSNANKKMVIKPFKVQPKLPENFEETTWEKLKVSTACSDKYVFFSLSPNVSHYIILQRAIVAVQSKEAVSLSHEELYRAVEDLCVHKMGARLYQRLKEECARHVATTVAGLNNQVKEEAFLT